MNIHNLGSKSGATVSGRKSYVIKVLLIGFFIACITASLLVWAIYNVTTTIMSTSISVSKTYEVLSAIDQLQSYLLDVETGERGYVITGEPSYLPAYVDTLKKIELQSNLISALTSNDPTHTAMLAELKQLVAYRLKTIQIIVQTRQAGSIDAAHELVSLKEDKLEMDRIRAVLNQMKSDENVRLNTRLITRDTAYKEFWWIFATLLLALFAGAIWQIRQVRRIIDLEILAERQIRYLAEHDPLTDLPNRRLLQHNLELAIAMAKRSGKQLAVMFIDLDGFKNVNDKLGHQAGDELLMEIAQRLREGTRVNDLVARLGGDEFIVVLTELDHPESATRIAKTLTEKIAKPFGVANSTARISASIGISLYPENGTSSEQLLSKADDAVYMAKAAGKNQYQWAANARCEAMTPE